jgi:hypothetical protein
MASVAGNSNFVSFQSPRLTIDNVDYGTSWPFEDTYTLRIDGELGYRGSSTRHSVIITFQIRDSGGWLLHTTTMTFFITLVQGTRFIYETEPFSFSSWHSSPNTAQIFSIS